MIDCKSFFIHMTDTFRAPRNIATLAELLNRDHDAPEYWQALLDIDEHLKNAFEALKNPTWCLNGNTSIIIHNLKRQKRRLERIRCVVEEDEEFDAIYRDTIQKAAEFIEQLQDMEIREIRIAQIQLTTYHQLRVVNKKDPA